MIVRLDQLIVKIATTRPVVKAVASNANLLTDLTDFMRKQGYGPGARLPPIRKLSTALGFGRNAIRDGLLEAQAKGYVKALEVPRDVVVTDGIRYRMYAGDRGFEPVAYANLARLKRRATALFARLQRP